MLFVAKGTGNLYTLRNFREVESKKNEYNAKNLFAHYLSSRNTCLIQGQEGNDIFLYMLIFT